MISLLLVWGATSMPAPSVCDLALFYTFHRLSPKPTTNIESQRAASSLSYATGGANRGTPTLACVCTLSSTGSSSLRRSFVNAYICKLSGTRCRFFESICCSLTVLAYASPCISVEASGPTPSASSCEATPLCTLRSYTMSISTPVSLCHWSSSRLQVYRNCRIVNQGIWISISLCILRACSRILLYSISLYQLLCFLLVHRVFHHSLHCFHLLRWIYRLCLVVHLRCQIWWLHLFVML